MVKCFNCGMNLFNIMEEGKKIVGINLGDKFGTYDKEQFDGLLKKEELDICCRIMVISYVPNKVLHYMT